MPRYRSLDSLRGIAALIVVFHHCSLVFPNVIENRADLLAHGTHAHLWWLYLTPLRLLVAGPAAVLVFFVLSGFVLVPSFEKHDDRHYRPFIRKRLARIWLPFAFAILASAALAVLAGRGAVPDTSTWFAGTWNQPITAGLIAEHLPMLGLQDTLDNPIWSLNHEMRIALVFPILVALTRWNWKVALGASVVLTIVCAKVAWSVGSTHVIRSFLMTAVYIVAFIAGIAMSQHAQAILPRLQRLSAVPHVLLWVVALGLLCLAPPFTGFIVGLTAAVFLLIALIGASLLLMLCAAEGRAHTWMTGKWPTRLGFISYSLYLIHLPIIAAAVHLLHGRAPLPLIVGAGAVVSIPAAYLMKRWVEVPSAALGARWAGQPASRTATAQPEPAE